MLLVARTPQHGVRGLCWWSNSKRRPRFMGLPFDKLRVVSGVEPRLVPRGKDADERGRTADLKGAGPRYASAIQTSVTGFIPES